MVGFKRIIVETEKIPRVVAYLLAWSSPLHTSTNTQLPANSSSRRQVTGVVVGLWRNNKPTLRCECQ